jgi:hypothetical protein
LQILAATHLDRRILASKIAEVAVMLWILTGGTVLTGVWLSAPTIRTFFIPYFPPTRRNDASVFQAQQSCHP